MLTTAYHSALTASLALTRPLRSFGWQAEAVHTERVDEGRWESEGGQPVHKLTSELSPDVAISDLAKTDNSSTAATTTATTAAAPTASSEYDAGKVHPQTLEGKPGDAAESRYPQPDISTGSAAGDSSATSSTDASDQPSTEAADTAGPAQPVARKKSISERLAETWQDFKHKVEDLTHKK